MIRPIRSVHSEQTSQLIDTGGYQHTGSYRTVAGFFICCSYFWFHL